MKKKFAVRLAIVAAIAVVAFASQRYEKQRMAVPLPGTAPSPQPTLLDQASLQADVRTLSGADFEGRRTGSPGNAKARALIAARFAKLGLAAYDEKGSYLMPFGFTHKSLRGLLTPGRKYETDYKDAANVVGYVRGTAAPEKVLVISAHYDHLGIRDGKIFHGADDNASGVGTLLALAAWYAAHPPRHTIIFAAFDGEELGKQGARHFVAHPPVPLTHIAANLNLDMLGHNDRNEIFAAGLYQTPGLRPYLDRAIERANVTVLSGHDRPMWMTGMVEDWTGSSDHAAFHDAGIPWLYFGVEDHPDYHAPSDTYERLNPAFLGRVAELVLRMAQVFDENLTQLPRGRR